MDELSATQQRNNFVDFLFILSMLDLDLQRGMCSRAFSQLPLY